jgi:MFS family permease
MTRQDRQAWTIAAALFVSLFFLWGGGYNTAPIFLAALLKAFGWTHARVAWITAALSLAIGVTGPVAGWLLDRIEAKFVMGGGAALAVAGLVAASRADGFASLLIAVIVLGVGLGASTWLAASLVIANWFGDRRGTALGVATAGMEFGGMAMTFVVGSVIAAYGWRMGYFVVAVPALFIVLPLLLIFVRTRPVFDSRHGIAEEAEPLPGFEVGEALRTRAFWMLVVAQLSYGLAVGGTFHHLVAYLEGLGYAVRGATIVVSIVLGLAAVGKAAMGALGDRLGGKNALALGFLIIAVSVLVLLGARQPAMVVLWLLLAGIAGASPVALVPLVLTETLGLKRLGTLFGWINLVVTIGLFAGPLMVGRITDITGNYTAAFELCSAMALVGGVASFFCVVPRRAPVGIMPSRDRQPHGGVAASHRRVGLQTRSGR